MDQKSVIVDVKEIYTTFELSAIILVYKKVYDFTNKYQVCYI